MSLSKTRWLVWLPVSEIILDQWYELRGFFRMKGEGVKVIMAQLVLAYTRHGQGRAAGPPAAGPAWPGSG